ncbi:metallophosphoesterase family protein [Allobacillus sp. GCM10007491]|uniref:Phosphoesterase n=1 Tax=Allobacillus saliphilus TaxID=2912308 RepID=A0A941HT77_9BACI|nr:metallophosphoesterase family protein [Allobacillus saliphilus]MBR7553480.1 metallophosphoesterase family protein [Allobacillus saliphilus]
MKVIVIGDTHMPKKAEGLPKRLVSKLNQADLIIHTGDWSSLDVYEELSRFAEVKGVRGNVDDAEIVERFPQKLLLTVKGFRIGVIHGDGTTGTTEKRALNAFKDDDVDVVLFGHSHIPYLRYHQKTLLINPGSPTDKRRVPVNSFVVLTIEETIEPSFKFFHS